MKFRIKAFYDKEAYNNTVFGVIFKTKLWPFWRAYDNMGYFKLNDCQAHLKEIVEFEIERSVNGNK